MKNIILLSSISLISSYCLANETKDTLPSYQHAIQYGVVNHHLQSIGINLSYTQKMKSNKLNRYGLHLVQYNSRKHIIEANRNGLYDKRRQITEVNYMASFGEQFFKSVFRNLDINCGYDISAGITSSNNLVTMRYTDYDNNVTSTIQTQYNYPGLALRITPYVGATVHFAKRLMFSSEFSFQSPRFSVYWNSPESNGTISDFNLYFLNTSFRFGYKF